MKWPKVFRGAFVWLYLDTVNSLTYDLIARAIWSPNTYQWLKRENAKDAARLACEIKGNK